MKINLRLIIGLLATASAITSCIEPAKVAPVLLSPSPTPADRPTVAVVSTTPGNPNIKKYDNTSIYMPYGDSVSIKVNYKSGATLRKIRAYATVQNRELELLRFRDSTGFDGPNETNKTAVYYHKYQKSNVKIKFTADDDSSKQGFAIYNVYTIFMDSTGTIASPLTTQYNAARTKGFVYDPTNQRTSNDTTATIGTADITWALKLKLTPNGTGGNDSTYTALWVSPSARDTTVSGDDKSVKKFFLQNGSKDAPNLTTFDSTQASISIPPKPLLDLPTPTNTILPISMLANKRYIFANNRGYKGVIWNVTFGGLSPTGALTQKSTLSFRIKTLNVRVTSDQ